MPDAKPKIDFQSFHCAPLLSEKRFGPGFDADQAIFRPDTIPPFEPIYPNLELISWENAGRPR